MARYQPKDRFYRKAKDEGFRARSAFKLQEILERLGVRGLAGGTLLDLGAAPGSWLQVLSRIAGPRGVVVGVDLVPIAPLSANVRTLTGDARDPAMLAQLRGLAPRGYDAVTSDMAPKTTGVADTDCARSLELSAAALGVARLLLKPGGSFLAKVFMGPDLDPFVTGELQPAFEKVRRLRPEATRAGSREIYLAGVGYRPKNDRREDRS
ncbi:MAG: SAM-dependent methyltransferase [Myxococcales bacterium]